MTKEEYLKMMIPWAKKAEQETGIPYHFIAGQWAYETANGTNRGSKELNNQAGIKYSKYAPAGTVQNGMYAQYPSMNEFIKDYKRVMSLSYYKPFTSNLKANDLDLIRNFAKTPWAETKYNETAMLNNMRLALEIGEGVKFVSPSIPSSGGSSSSNVNVKLPSIDGLGEADLKQWAVVGLSLAVALSLIPKN